MCLTLVKSIFSTACNLIKECEAVSTAQQEYYWQTKSKESMQWRKVLLRDCKYIATHPKHKQTNTNLLWDYLPKWVYQYYQHGFWQTWSTRLEFVSIHRQVQEQLQHGGGRERWRWSTKPCQAGPYSPPPSVIRIMIEIINIKVLVFKAAWPMTILRIYNLPQAAIVPQQESRRS